MAPKKKLQVFISSTFADLKQERQAAVEAILTAGHIPAGMELFTAGDESQMNVIKRWIDESDVYLLILGGRYGSIEPTTEKSYTHLEYEYAVEKQKPLFAVVIDEEYLEQKLKQYGFEVIERERQESLKNFRTYVLTRMVRFFSDPRDIKLAILETLSELERRPELVGWISGSEAIDGGALAGELARLAKENSQLRSQLQVSTSSPATYNGLTFQHMYKLLTSNTVDGYGLSGEILRSLKRIADAFGDTRTNTLHFLWFISGVFQDWQSLIETDPNIRKLINRLNELGIIEKTESTSTIVTRSYYRLTSGSKEFLVRMRVELELAAAEDYILRTMEDLKPQT
jgi:Domain of unknown function (DUF4062)